MGRKNAFALIQPLTGNSALKSDRAAVILVSAVFYLFVFIPLLAFFLMAIEFKTGAHFLCIYSRFLVISSDVLRQRTAYLQVCYHLRSGKF